MDTRPCRGLYHDSQRGACFVLALLFSALPAAAAGGGQIAADPIATGNRLPFLAIHGLPPARSAYLLNEDSTRLYLHADAANSSIVERAPDGRLTIIDGETHRLELDIRHGLGGGWDIGLTLPFLRHSGGFLDRPIERWHEFFQLPNGNRDRLPRDRLLFSQSSPDAPGFQLDSAGGGIGDLQLSASRRLGAGLALRGMLKLPTGSSQQLTGSGATAFATSLHASRNLGDSLTWHISGGLLISGNGDVLRGQRENLLGIGSTTLAWRVSGNWVLKAQLDGHTAAYHDTGSLLDRGSLQLSLAAAFAMSRDWSFEVGFSEDIAVETAPDIAFHGGFQRRF
ncbi:DUF3187 family protein [Chromatocurvus halotolerans]|uniref:DUF3187 family protein n=1 Tax=Chromatocurvus halotolerans TaxID=1132028 RepID=UPI0013C36DA7|nr:DUF3187 family protein [Chromatocurvus halotolerans]